MTAFVESCVETVTGSAAAVARQTRGKPRVRQLLRLLASKKTILITTHEDPDPDALAASLALQTLLTRKLPDAEVKVSVKGNIGGGINQTFAQLSGLRPIPWDLQAVEQFAAIILLDTQPQFANSPLPEKLLPLAVIDHHRAPGPKFKCGFCDIRGDVGAVSSIIFGYFMELELSIPRDLAAAMLFAIESDLAGAAGQPGELDNIALSSLTLMADTRKLYRMRYADLPQDYFVAYFHGMSNAAHYDGALMSHIEQIDSPEKPAVIADFLLRYDQVKWALVTAVAGQNLVLSLRTNASKKSAADIMRRLVRDLGEGGGHRTKAGGIIPLSAVSTAEIERVRAILRRRYLRGLGIRMSRGQRLLPEAMRRRM
jgi:nanoRNase/pAp phosphatase (c-di-AMP/oligoRNAs hydrolase)